MNRWRWLVVVGWLAGTVGAWWLTPVGPRDGWQPPRRNEWVGVLADGRTAVTTAYRMRSPTSGEPIGPIRVCDVATGELCAQILAADEPFAAACVVPGTDWVCVSGSKPLGPPPDKPMDAGRPVRSATLYAARTGTPVATLVLDRTSS